MCVYMCMRVCLCARACVIHIDCISWFLVYSQQIPPWCAWWQLLNSEIGRIQDVVTHSVSRYELP